MPKAMSYTKGSIIYFEGDIDDRVFILQKGHVVITTTDVETKLQTSEQIKQGEFFGVKSAIGHFPREETVMTLDEAVCISMTSQEFENLFSNNKQLIMKMLRVFSNQLRQIHKKTESVMNNNENFNQMDGLLGVARAFYSDEKWQSCEDVCKTYLRLYPTEANNKEVKEMLLKSSAYVKKGISSADAIEETAPSATGSSIKMFDLPAFKRFQKTYENGQVIITEYERGETFYLIQNGTVQLTKCINDTNKNLDILKPGEFFGEMAILDNTPRSATCVAKGHVECLEFNKANFEMLITGNPQLALILLKIFCKRIYDQRRRLRILVISDPQARLADVFCMFNEMNQTAITADRKRKFSVTEQDMVHWSGLPSNVAKDELKRFVVSRKIEMYDNYIIVNNIADMQRIVDSRTDIKK
ncbi:MAG: cyclic nucleotide-binding domain-containing protein [Treponema sp.]|uniref:Crp/Fnr family transcriptional regulator n=1 Tax=Treponema sp. TaxID=166 RepID=UPI0025EEB231|nr:cyclic nucleotide-binding domain-containing protein [Treponema sp.]MBQ9283274.1 cyclic nucleotide-binding domain-containing protein [Treponema sp.]